MSSAVGRLLTKVCIYVEDQKKKGLDISFSYDGEDFKLVFPTLILTAKTIEDFEKILQKHGKYQHIAITNLLAFATNKPMTIAFSDIFHDTEEC